MKVVLTTETALAAVVLKGHILSAIKGDVDNMDIDTWSYVKSGDNYDIIYHNPLQYVNAPEKNVVFRVEVEGTEVMISTAWWSSKPVPSKEMLCLHTGRLVEMLLRYFSGGFMKFNIVDF
jgi:hypothetical protein